ncbi:MULTISPECIES: JmjC domain-containing protein [Streptomyces]|uniref:JmjC domain-containing protein n=1 Tax=Streptomyces TaxID=1883 RepID=UPI0004AA468E|nr:MULTISPECIES: cupin domain-containing protein [Streptomyces]
MQTALSRLATDPNAFRTGWPTVPTVYDRDAADLQLLATRQAAREILADPDIRPYSYGMVRSGVLTAERASADHPTDTLVCNGLHESYPPIVAFCKDLARQLGHPITGNLYLTPAGEAQGFGWHWDCHNVLIAQTEGAKLWRIFRPTFTDPLEHRHHNWSRIGFAPEDKERFEATDPDYEFNLTAGQVLFIPRGWVHAGRTGPDQHSLHLTFGVQLLTEHWALQKLLEAGGESVELRGALPPNLAGADFEALAEHLRSTLVKWVTDQSAEELGAKLRSAQRMSIYHGTPQ